MLYVLTQDLVLPILFHRGSCSHISSAWDPAPTLTPRIYSTPNVVFQGAEVPSNLSTLTVPAGVMADEYSCKMEFVDSLLALPP